MAARFDLVTLNSPVPDTAASFWAAALGLAETEREDGDRWIVLGEPGEPGELGGRRRIGLQRGTVEAGTVHLDLVCEPHEFDAEVARLAGLGAHLLRPARREPYGSIANFADPDGNPFDLCAYRHVAAGPPAR